MTRRRKPRRAPSTPTGPHAVARYNLDHNTPDGQRGDVWSYRTKTTEHFHADIFDKAGKYLGHFDFTARRRGQ
jgi:hypothetical protein